MRRTIELITHVLRKPMFFVTSKHTGKTTMAWKHFQMPNMAALRVAYWDWPGIRFGQKSLAPFPKTMWPDHVILVKLLRSFKSCFIFPNSRKTTKHYCVGVIVRTEQSDVVYVKVWSALPTKVLTCYFPAVPLAQFSSLPKLFVKSKVCWAHC